MYLRGNVSAGADLRVDVGAQALIQVVNWRTDREVVSDLFVSLSDRWFARVYVVFVSK